MSLQDGKLIGGITAVGVIGLLLILIFNITTDGSAPDGGIVVGVVTRCVYAEQEYAGDICGEERTRRTSWREITVRTADGETYAAKLDGNVVVKIGDTWPPER